MNPAQVQKPVGAAPLHPCPATCQQAPHSANHHSLIYLGTISELRTLQGRKKPVRVCVCGGGGCPLVQYIFVFIMRSTPELEWEPDSL